jgi:hypothetical protein
MIVSSGLSSCLKSRVTYATSIDCSLSVGMGEREELKTSEVLTGSRAPHTDGSPSNWLYSQKLGGVRQVTTELTTLPVGVMAHSVGPLHLHAGQSFFSYFFPSGCSLDR